MDHHRKFWICRMLNVIFTPNKTCKTKLQCCTSHFTIIVLGVTDISVDLSANSECVSNRMHCSYYKFINHQKSITVKRQSVISRLQGLKQLCRVRLNIQKSQLSKLTVLNYVLTCK